jgi:hypothetical protein
LLEQYATFLKQTPVQVRKPAYKRITATRAHHPEITV